MATKSKTARASKASKAKGAKVAKADGARIPLKAICSELGLDPKASRVKLRRARRVDGSLAFHARGSRWDLTKSEAAEVRAILG